MEKEYYYNSYKEIEAFVLDKIREVGVPNNHPFLDYPNTPESMGIKLIILIYLYTGNAELVTSLIKKSLVVQNGKFSYQRYNQGINETIWLNYLLSSLFKINKLEILKQVFSEEYPVYNNGKKFEYSILINYNNTLSLITSEIKSIVCDPFEKEIDLSVDENRPLIKSFFPNVDIPESELDKNVRVLKSSTHYYQVSKSIKKICDKSKGDNISGYNTINIGVLFINYSTSFEEFLSYLFHKKYGLYNLLLGSNIDAFVLISLDAYNDLAFENIYKCGYVQTALIKPTDYNKELMKSLRLDNYISLGYDVPETVYNLAQREYGKYKILQQDHKLNIIPYDADEKKIKEYMDYLNNKAARYN